MEVIVSVGPDIGAASRAMVVEYSRCTERLYVVEAVWGAVISLDWSGVDGVWSSNLKDHYRGVGGDCLEAGTKVELSRVTFYSRLPSSDSIQHSVIFIESKVRISYTSCIRCPTLTILRRVGLILQLHHISHTKQDYLSYTHLSFHSYSPSYQSPSRT